MARAQYHYAMDLFFPNANEMDGFRKESSTIAAAGDAEAIRECQRLSAVARPYLGPSVPPEFFQVRKVFRRRHEIIFDSSKEPRHP